VPAEAHLFAVRVDDSSDAELLNGYHALLSSDERARGERYFFEVNRREHLVAHGLKRLALSRLAGIDPSLWRFDEDANGKPFVAGPTSHLRFNLAHTAGMVVCLVAADADVGVDVEDVERTVATVDISESFFAEPEVAALRRCGPAEQRARFFEYWTLKEAYIKARGLGLALPLGSFWFTWPAPERPTIHFAPPIVDRPERWSFFQWFLSPRHRIAAAIERRDGMPQVVLHEGPLPCGSPRR
jgi:4'-phosphopantetheinyl transferase